jgi:hypothetical protein
MHRWCVPFLHVITDWRKIKQTGRESLNIVLFTAKGMPKNGKAVFVSGKNLGTLVNEGIL